MIGLIVCINQYRKRDEQIILLVIINIMGIKNIHNIEKKASEQK
jgi:hypothetical protein